MGCCTLHILAVGTAAADPHSCWWRRSAADVVAAVSQQGLELSEMRKKQSLDVREKLVLPNDF